MKNLILALLLAVSVIPVKAQTICRRDSTGCAFDAKRLMAPSSLIASGLGIHFLAHDTWDLSIRNSVQHIVPPGGQDIRFDDYVQYLPLVMDLGLGLTGAKADNGFADRVIEGALAYASLGILSRSSKLMFHTLRPNGVDYLSFPSGHSCFVFTGAELVRLEYGAGWGAAAYGVACIVGGARIYRDWHWFSDVLMGAGLGILSADIGHWLKDPLKRLLNLNTDGIRIGIAPTVDPYSGTMCTQFALNF